jgi:hypothetical protein
VVAGTEDLGFLADASVSPAEESLRLEEAFGKSFDVAGKSGTDGADKFLGDFLTGGSGLIGEGVALAFKAGTLCIGISSPFPSLEDSSDESDTALLFLFAIDFLREEGGEDFLGLDPEFFFLLTSSMVRATFLASSYFTFSAFASRLALALALLSTSSGKSAIVVREVG